MIAAAILLCLPSVSTYTFPGKGPGSMTAWDALSTAMKGHARKWFITRATDKGIDWEGKSKFYMAKINELEVKEEAMFASDVKYPSYYTRPFHGYDEGNLNWLAACELEASTESMSSGYFADVDPAAGAARMRQTFASNIEGFAQRHEARPLRQLLDMGCSIGISTEEHLKRIESVESAVGVDLSPHFLAIGKLNAERKELPVSYVHANVDELQMAEAADVVTIAFVFHEMPPEAIANTIRAAYRTLRPGGVFAVLDLDPQKLTKTLTGFRRWGFEATEPHIFSYYNQDIAALLSQGGFEAVEEHVNDPYNSGWIGLKPHDEHSRLVWGI